MSERPVLILGAGSDIGLAIAHAFARQKRPIQLAARRPEELERDVKDIAIRHEVSVTAHRFDATAMADMDAFYDGLPETPGVVVSVVGYLGEQAAAEGQPDEIRRVVDTNFTGPALALETAARRLAALEEDTAVVGVSSVAGDRGRAVNYWYGAAKAGFTAALSGMRQKYARSRLHVMTVKPGFVATKMTEGMDLPKPLTSSPQEIAQLTVNGVKARRGVAYPWKWWIVMTIIRALPEFVFKRMKM